MTDEINERIFLLRGWKFDHRDDCLFSVYKNDKGEKSLLPSFTHDPRYAMELFKEMAGKELLISMRHYQPTDLWIVELYNENATKVKFRCEGDTPELAICLAWLEWKEKK